MNDRIMSLESQIAKLENNLHDAREIALYYQWLALKSGMRSIREIDRLLNIHSQQKETERKLQYRIDLDTLIHTISTHFLEAANETIDQKIIWTLGVIGIFYKVDRCLLVRITENGTQADVTHEWCAEGVEPRIKLTSTFTKEEKTAAIRRCNTSEPVVIPDVGNLTDDSLFNFYYKQGIKSFISVPMLYNDNQIHRLCFDFINSTRTWNDDDIMMIHTIADIIVNAIERNRIEEESHKLSEQLAVRQRIDSLGTMTGGIVHDLNNLLASITGNIELSLLTTSGDYERCREYLTRAMQTGRRAINLINEIRLFINGSSFEIADVDVYPIVLEAFEAAKQPSESRIEMRVDFPVGEWRVLGNTDLLHQVFLNLTVNAINAIKERTLQIDGRIVVTAEKISSRSSKTAFSATRKLVHIQFKDNGAGMSDEVKRHAFDPMFTTRRKHGAGQGLGLAMVSYIINEIIGGSIEIESHPGSGTVMHMYLPEATDARIQTAEASEIVTEGKETVLIIDDEESIRDFTCDTLAMHGYNVLTANSGEEGIELYTRYQDTVDIVLLDLGLPGISGEETMNMLRDIRHDITVVLTSGMIRDLAEKNRETSTFLMKPYTIASLLSTIRTTLDAAATKRMR